MHDIFGKGDRKCKDCQHYKTFKYRDKPYRKCEIYGITQSKSSDWKASYDSCGLFPDKEPIGIDKDIIRLSNREKAQEEQINGQINLFDSV